MPLTIQPLGDTGVRVQMGDAISPEIHRRIRSFCLRLEQRRIPGVVEWVPAYCSVTVYYQPHIIRFSELCHQLRAIEDEGEAVETVGTRTVILPVAYGGERGPDLPFVAEVNGLTEEEVIRIHSEASYRVYMMGFAPGFPYLGGMSPSIAAPRLERPRSKIAAGSVGIAGFQTGVYSLETPGGWRIIGRTPVPLYDPDQEDPVLLRAGDVVRFRPVDEATYSRIEKAVQSGTYTAEIILGKDGDFS